MSAWIVGILLSLTVALIAWRRRSLAPSGVVGAMLIGTVLFGMGGLVLGLVLIAFFVSSSALSRFKSSDARKRRAAEMFEKGGQRDLGQVLANGGAAALAVLLGACVSEPMAARMLWAALGALATMNGDTWATELGVLARRPPRQITRPWRSVEPGTSGGVSLPGTLAALAGAAFIGVCAVVLAHTPLGGASWNALPVRSLRAAALPAVAILAVAGLLGALTDSLLGATVQAVYRHPDGRETEQARADDGTPHPQLRGLPWMHNDLVNFLASLAGAAFAAALSHQ